MNDIANASEKGRRTIYTYFKSKTDIFNAVVRHETDIVIERLQKLPDMPLTPEEKLMNFIFIRFEAIKEVISRNGSLRASFFLDVRKVHKARNANAAKEVEILKRILQEGVDSQVFRIKHVDKAAMILLLCLQGLDVHYARNSFEDIGIDKLKLRAYINDFILHGIKADTTMNKFNQNIL